MNCRNYVLFAFILICSCAPRSVVIDKNLETIPKDIAIEYLQNESNSYSSNFKCLYSKFGVGGIPYSELEFQVLQNVWGNQMIILWKKGTAGTYTFMSENSAWVCNPIEAGGWDAKDYPKEEVDEALNKTASALVSVGVRMVD